MHRHARTRGSAAANRACGGGTWTWIGVPCAGAAWPLAVPVRSDYWHGRCHDDGAYESTRCAYTMSRCFHHCTTHSGLVTSVQSGASAGVAIAVALPHAACRRHYPR